MKHIWAVEMAGHYRGDWVSFAFFTDAESAEKYRADMIAAERETEDGLRVVRVELNPTWGK